MPSKELRELLQELNFEFSSERQKVKRISDLLIQLKIHDFSVLVKAIQLTMNRIISSL